MRTLKFQGSSDDTFELIHDSMNEYHLCDSHDNCANFKPICFKLYSKAVQKGLIVFGQYCGGNTDGWVTGISVIDDISPEPNWVKGYELDSKPHRYYAPIIVLEVPDDIEISLYYPTVD